MGWNKAPWLALLAGLFVTAGARRAEAHAAPACAPVAVATDANVRRRWPDLPEQIQHVFELRDDVDACARIDITITGAAVVLKVTLPDGRTAARTVSRREDVLAALEALLLLPETGVVAAPPAPPTEPGTPAKPARAEPPARLDATVNSTPSLAAGTADRGSLLRIELGLGLEARAGDGQMGAGVGVASFVELAHWLFGFQARIDRYQMIAGGDNAMTAGTSSIALELDALFGRRFDLGASTLDLVAGPALAMHGNVSMTAPANDAMAQASPPPDEQGLPRLLVSSRLTFRARSLLRTFVQLDGEIGRRPSPPEALPDQAALPAWTVGLAIGATVGTR
jgi:hypothetical protein